MLLTHFLLGFICFVIVVVMDNGDIFGSDGMVGMMEMMGMVVRMVSMFFGLMMGIVVVVLGDLLMVMMLVV